MNSSWKFLLLVLFVISFLVLGFSASNSTNLQVTSPLQVNGSKLEVGNYKVMWIVNGDKVDVVFKNGKTEVKTTAKLEEAKVVYANTAVMKTTNGVMKQLWVGGKTTTLIFAE